MELKERISAWVDAHEADMIRDLSALVAIESVRGPALPGAPFGPGPKGALDAALELCASLGLETASYGGAVGSADLGPSPAGLDILCHVDVVDAGEGWTGDPFTLTQRGGLLYGRGTDDDKGPAVEAIYALACLRELGLPLRRGARLLLGTSEECGMDDLPYYYDHNAPAPMTFSPDSGFPCYNTEKGAYHPVVTARWGPSQALPRVSAMEGGTRLNVVPGEASATVLGLTRETALALCAPRAQALGVLCSAADGEGGCLLRVSGVSCHAAMPEGGVNAITALLALLAALPLAECGSTGAIRALAAALPHGDYYGAACGVASRDDISGPTTVSPDILSLTELAVELRLDCRVCLTATEESCRLAFERRLGELGLSVSGQQKPAHHVDPDCEFVRTLLECYRTYTGDAGRCLSTGGWTYVHSIPGGVAFGSGMPGFDSRLHSADERISRADMLAACKIFALAAARLCCDLRE